MNWRRGITRLWIVVSVLWVAFATWALDPIQKLHDAGAPVVVPFCNARIEFPSDTPVAVVRKALTDFGRGEAKKKECADLFLDGVDATVDRSMSSFQPQPVWKTLYPMMVLMFLPPLLLFAAALVCLWIARGFRERPA